MAAGHQPSPAPVELVGVEGWLKALQQALQVEADRGFGDLKGRLCCFSVFVVQQLGEPPAELPAEALGRVLAPAEELSWPGVTFSALCAGADGGLVAAAVEGLRINSASTRLR